MDENNINDISTELCNKADCTGCSACMNICPKDAINMSYDAEGFLFPVIDVEECIGCRRCISVCPLHDQEEWDVWKVRKVVLAYAKDKDELKKGSSGAVFPILAESVIKKNGVVFGAAYDSEKREVVHISSDKVDLSELFRSKYVQSRVGNIYIDVKKYLEEGRMVLFSGTPCQIDGLYRYLKKEYSNLITVNFICHGVPSPGVLRKRLIYFERREQSKITNCTFREKDNGWRQQVIKLYFENGQVQKKSSRFGVYYNLFIHNYILRQSCYICSFYKKHKSDITLADAWNSNMNEEGVSRVYVNTQKGEQYLECELDRFYIHNESVMDDLLLKFEHQYTQDNRRFFYKYYKEKKNNRLLFLICWLRCLWTRLLNKII